LDSTDLPTLQHLGRLLSDQGLSEEAFKIYQTILVHHRDTMDEENVARVFFGQGVIKRELGESKKALDFFRKALAIEPENEEGLRAIIGVHEEREDWEDVVHYRRRLLELLSDEEERFQLLVSVGQILDENLSNFRSSAESYDLAKEMRPSSKLVLGRLYELHEKNENWDGAIDALSQLAEAEEDTSRQAKYWCGVASIQQNYLDDRFTAVRSFDRALDADPSLLRAFEAIDHILTEDCDYERQDRYYRKMLKRATETGLGDKLVFSLAKNLGEINRTRLQRYDVAAKAYKIALGRKPDDHEVNEILAQIYELEDKTEEAIAQYQKLIALDPRRVANYRNLKRLFMENGRYDEAWCVCQALCFLNVADQDERVFFEKYRSRTLKQAQKDFDPEYWALIQYGERDTQIDIILQRLFPYVLPVMSIQPKDIQLNKRKHGLDPAEQIPFNKVSDYVAQILRLNRPECFIDPRKRQGLTVVNLAPPSILVGEDVIRGARMQELAFMVAKYTYLLFPQHFLAIIDETYERKKARLMGTIYTLTRLVNSDADVKFDANLLEALAETIPPAELTELGKLIQEVIHDSGRQLDISRWLESVEHTANRLGLIFANDLESAARSIKNETITFSRAKVQDRIRELVVFSLSAEYFHLRKALGLSLAGQR
jgi:tetratricopeptide (TPR) repeat protein